MKRHWNKRIFFICTVLLTACTTVIQHCPTNQQIAPAPVIPVPSPKSIPTEKPQDHPQKTRRPDQRRHKHPLSPEQIAASAKGYLVKVLIIKPIKIPFTNQIIYKDVVGFGSGSAVRCKKYEYCVLTAFHVVRDTDVVFMAENEDGLPAQKLELIQGTTIYDCAILRYADPQFRPKSTVPIGQSSKLVRGSPIYSMGSSLYGYFWFSGSGNLFTRAKRADPWLDKSLKSIEANHPRLLLFSTSFFRGYSGGPILNKYGELIGINIAYFSDPPEAVYIGSPIDGIIETLKIIQR